ncbi:unnamed protein product [Phaeothamnion confervicola]
MRAALPDFNMTLMAPPNVSARGALDGMIGADVLISGTSGFSRAAAALRNSGIAIAPTAEYGWNELDTTETVFVVPLSQPIPGAEDAIGCKLFGSAVTAAVRADAVAHIRRALAEHPLMPQCGTGT